MIRVEGALLFPYGLPMTQPLLTARGRFTHRRGWLLALDDQQDRRGWGDAAPWPGFGTSSEPDGDERVSFEIAELCAPHGGLLGACFESTTDISAWLGEQQLKPEVAYAVELALLDLLGQATQQSIARLLYPEASSAAASHALVIARPDPRAGHLKVKVGAASLDADLARVAAVRASARANALLRLDAGCGWSPEQAAHALPRLATYGIDWIEQPVSPGQLPTCAGLREQAHELGFRIALDEEVRCAADVDAILQAGAADVIVIKPMFVGGVLAARAIAQQAQRQGGVEVIVTNALESAIGRAGTVHLAAGLAGVHGLGGSLGVDLADAPKREGSAVAVPTGFGLGVTPHQHWLACHEAPPAPGPSQQQQVRDAVPHPLASAALARPDHPALIADDQRYSYRELRNQVARCAAVLRGRGIAPNMTVALDGPRDARYAIWLHAVGWLGASAAPLAPRATDRERGRQLATLAPHAIIDTREAPPAADAPELDERYWPPSEVRLSMCTSGSTGTPRPVALSTTQLVLSAFGSAIALGHVRDDRWLCCLPLHHVGGLSILLRASWYATTVILHERFDAKRTAHALDCGDVTMVSLVPAMLEQVLDARQRMHGADVPFPESLRAILVGGAALPDTLRARCDAISAPVAATWGMTEAASQVATSAPGDLAQGAPPIAFARVHERDGRLHVHGPVVGNPVVSGDRGRVDAAGRVHVHGRVDDLIVSGGEKLAPREIESLLRRHPAIRDAVVVGMPSPAWGARPWALLVAADGHRPDGEALRSWCRDHIANFKVPDEMVWCEAIPRTTLGKVSRMAVRALLDDHEIGRNDSCGRLGGGDSKSPASAELLTRPKPPTVDDGSANNLKKRAVT